MRAGKNSRQEAAAGGGRIPGSKIAWCLLPTALPIVIFDFGDSRKRYLHYFTIRALYLDAGSGECLRGFHAANCAPHALAVNRDDLNIVFAIKRSKRRQRLCDFHLTVSSRSSTAADELFY